MESLLNGTIADRQFGKVKESVTDSVFLGFGVLLRNSLFFNYFFFLRGHFSIAAKKKK